MNEYELMTSKSEISAEDLRILCIEMDWFTGGTNAQYQKLFDMNADGCPLEELALAIWLCSSGTRRDGGATRSPGKIWRCGMNYSMAKIILEYQDQQIRKVDGFRLKGGGYEYRIVYEGGFSAFVRIDRRQVGRRVFRYFAGVSAADCRDYSDVMHLVREEIRKRGGIV